MPGGLVGGVHRRSGGGTRCGPRPRSDRRTRTTAESSAAQNNASVRLRGSAGRGSPHLYEYGAPEPDVARRGLAPVADR